MVLLEIAIGILRGAGTAIAKLLIPSPKKFADGVVTETGAQVGPHLKSDEATQVIEQNCDAYPELLGLLSCRDRDDFRAISDLGGALLYIDAPGPVKAAVATAVSAAHLRTRRYDLASETTRRGLRELGFSGTESPPEDLGHPGIACALLLNGATAESHRPNRDEALEMLACVAQINPHHVAYRFNRLCFAVRFQDEQLIVEAARDLLREFPSAAWPTTPLGQSICSDEALVPFRTTRLYRLLFPRHCVTTAWRVRSILRQWWPLLLVVGLAIAILVLANPVSAEMSVGLVVGSD